MLIYCYAGGWLVPRECLWSSGDCKPYGTCRCNCYFQVRLNQETATFFFILEYYQSVSKPQSCTQGLAKHQAVRVEGLLFSFVVKSKRWLAPSMSVIKVTCNLTNICTGSSEWANCIIGRTEAGHRNKWKGAESGRMLLSWHCFWR